MGDRDSSSSPLPGGKVARRCFKTNVCSTFKLLEKFDSGWVGGRRCQTATASPVGKADGAWQAGAVSFCLEAHARGLPSVRTPLHAHMVLQRCVCGIQVQGREGMVLSGLFVLSHLFNGEASSLPSQGRLPATMEKRHDIFTFLSDMRAISLFSLPASALLPFYFL